MTRWVDSLPPAEGPVGWKRCRECGNTFEYSLDFFNAKGLTPPLRCEDCRRRRRERLRRVVATVTKVVPGRFIFAEDAGGQSYYIAPVMLRPGARDLEVGERIVLDVDPEAPVVPGKLPRALGVRRV